MKILSLFDGMACGHIAMQLAGVPVDKYVAYEIDKYAVQTAQHNFPDIEEKGDVFTADFTQYEGYDWLVGGSPCTYWSIAQTKNRETTASGMGWELFSQYVRALKEAKPKRFIYENNKSMSAAIRESICDAFGFEPICINSALVSAQNRQRLYWVGIRNEDGTYRKAEIEQPEDRKIFLKDILENGAVSFLDKAYAYTTRCQGAIIENTLEKHQHTMVAEPVNMTKDGKAHCIRATCYKDGIRNIVGNEIDKRTGVAERIPEYGIADKSRPVSASYAHKGAGEGSLKADAFPDNPVKQVFDYIAEPIKTLADKLPECFRVKEATKQGFTDIEPGDCVDMAMPNSKTRRGRNMKEKSNCLQTSCSFYQYCGTASQPIYEVKDGMITIKGKQYPIKLVDGYYIIRKLTVRECMRLQTVPEWYEFPVSNSQAYKMLGNGWTCEVIAHLIRGALEG